MNNASKPFNPGSFAGALTESLYATSWAGVTLSTESMIAANTLQISNGTTNATDGGGLVATPANAAPVMEALPQDTVVLEAHEYTNIFPELTADAVAELTVSVRENGQINAIVLFEGKILDGRGLYKVCRALGTEPKVQVYSGNDPLGYIVAANHARRHYMNESQRALVAAKIATLKLGANQHSKGLPIGRASELMDVSPRSVARARKVLELGDPDVIADIESGDLSVSAAVAREDDDMESSPDTGPSVRSPSEDSNQDPAPATDPIVKDSSPVETPTLPPTVESPSITEPSQAEVNCPLTFSLPKPGIVIVVGDAKAAVQEVAIKIGATVSAADLWPDYRRAERGNVIWLSCRSKAPTSLYAQFEAAGAYRQGIHFVHARLDDFGLPIRHLSNDLHRLDDEIAKMGPVSCVIVDHLSEYLQSDDIEKSIRSFQRAIDALHEFAGKHDASIILPCQLPTNNQDVVAQALAAVGSLEAVNAVLLVERETKPNRGTVTPVKDKVSADAGGFPFQLRNRNSVPAVVWDGVSDEFPPHIS